MNCELANAFDLIQKPHATRYGGQTAVSVGGSGGDTSLLYSGGIHLFQYLTARRYVKNHWNYSKNVQKLDLRRSGHYTSGGMESVYGVIVFIGKLLATTRCYIHKS